MGGGGNGHGGSGYGEVVRDRNGRVWQFAGEYVQIVLGAGHQGDARPGLSQSARNRRTNASRGAGHQRRALRDLLPG